MISFKGFLNEVKVNLKRLTLNKAPWKYLIHFARDGKKENRDKLLEVGPKKFKLRGKLGIYTTPNYKPMVNLDKDVHIKITTKDNIKILDTGGRKATELWSGIGKKEYGILFADILKKMGIDISEPKKDFDYDWLKSNFKEVTKFNHTKFIVLFKQYLKRNKYDVLINGGEIIIINVNCIESWEPYVISDFDKNEQEMEKLESKLKNVILGIIEDPDEKKELEIKNQLLKMGWDQKAFETRFFMEWGFI